MSVQTNITITHGSETIGTIEGKLLKAASKPREEATHIRNFFDAAAIGQRSCKTTVQVTSGDQATASGTFTFSAHASASDTVLINGVTFTGETSGATGNQFNVGTTATLTASALAAAINASATALVSGTVVATSALGVVTITAAVSGLIGNAITIAKGTDSGSVNTVSGARLTGGANPTTLSAQNTYHTGL